MDNKKPSIAHERRIDYYPRPRSSVMIKAYAEVKGIGKSEAVEISVTAFINSLPQNERELLLRQVNGK